jgi:transposase
MTASASEKTEQEGGPRTVTYLKHVQHVSFQRLQAMFADVFGLMISQSALGNIFDRARAAFHGKAVAIVARLRTASALASDETGVRIEGVNAQHWVFRADGIVFHQAAFSRAAQVVRNVMGGHRPAFWTSDRYSAQQGHGERHQTCLAHLARDIAWMGDVFALWRHLCTFAASTIARKRSEPGEPDRRNPLRPVRLRRDRRIAAQDRQRPRATAGLP